MKKSTTLVILAVSALLAVFALGTLTSRPAQAQLSRPSGSFPHQSEFWQVRTNPNNYQPFASPDNSNIQGYVFDVTPDSLGRLPVLTDWLFQDGQNFHFLWMKGGDGFYRVILSVGAYSGSSAHYSPGILLRAGQYALTFNGSSPSPSLDRIALSGGRSMPY